jgi:hypothetical protein
MPSGAHKSSLEEDIILVPDNLNKQVCNYNVQGTKTKTQDKQPQINNNNPLPNQ